tara:strand:- start:1503 stop:2042 length:540 start_codon:yes stop_codon:yes gene_type:complete
MDPATIATAIAGTKLLVKGAKDISEITKSLDSVFSAKEAHEKNVKKPTDSVAKRNQGILEKRAHDGGKDTDISTVANEVIQQKQLEASLKDLEYEINRKYPVPYGEKKTWDLIIEKREEKIKLKKERARKRKEKEALKKEESREFWQKVWMYVWQSVVVVGALGALWWFLVWAAEKGAS